MRVLLICIATFVLVSVTPRFCHAESWQLNNGDWQRVEEIDGTTAKGQLQLLRQRLQLTGDAAAVIEDLELWFYVWPADALEAEARLLRGDCLVHQGKLWDALYDYEYIGRRFASTPTYFVAAQREYDISLRFINGWKRKFLGMPMLSTVSEGHELLILIQERLPGSMIAEQACMALADHYFDSGEMELAAELYDIFLINHPRSVQRNHAMRRLIQASLARYNGPAFDTTGLTEALERLRQYQQEFPVEAERLGVDALALRIEESMAENDSLSARWYARRHMYVSEATQLRHLINTYPHTRAAQKARERMADLGLPLVDPRDPGREVEPPAPDAEGGPGQGDGLDTTESKSETEPSSPVEGGTYE